ncbi:hypothetical protein [Hyphomicrobium sp. ghe19]|uniref:hypothetical protein n=1 Tax=Hyphomicrobium sp. ghe19 TaxID=2682968 RepID=UPI001366DB72|nr:hypothetical protein HYPP_00925 [Hyphomicrobium sp. ghe19]
MTLLVAAIEKTNVWMAADAAVSGVGTEERHREFALKVVPSSDSRALIGFAGDIHYGQSLTNAAAALSDDDQRIKFLVDGQSQAPNTSFAYAYKNTEGPHLLKIGDGEVQRVQTLYLGVKDAFEQFQSIRHATELDPTPKALKTFLPGSRSSEPLPSGLTLAITSMLRLFAERGQRDVGGWVTPYFLTSEGSFLCGYGFAVSDPIFDKILPGSLVPHGTAEEGGFGLSVTELGISAGVIIYWLQLPGGLVFVRNAENYDVFKFDGKPSDFIKAASEKIERKIEILFGDQPHGPPKSITVLRDENGTPSVAIAHDGRAFSISVLNVYEPFRTQAAVDFSPAADPDLTTGLLSSNRVKATLSNDKLALNLTLLANGEPTTVAELSAGELETVLGVLGENRWRMREPVAAQPASIGATGSLTRELIAVDPSWRAELPIHPTLNGISLRFRHPGFGWITFQLPWHEAKSLGTWLVKNSPPSDATS